MTQNNPSKIMVSILSGDSLSSVQIHSLFSLVETGEKAGEALLETYLMVLKQRGIETSELQAVLKFLMSKAHRLQVPSRFMDVCGTGGDSSHTFNISTATSFVVASCGVPVLKHGNRSVSSHCGSSDLLESLGIDLERAAKYALATLKKFNFGYLHAPLMHPFLARVAPIRKKIGRPTLFNFLGPLLHPARPKIQLAGVSCPGIFEKYPDWLKAAGRKRAVVCQGEGGIDEATPFGTTRILELRDGRVSRSVIRARDFGFKAKSLKDLQVKSRNESIRVFRGLLGGTIQGPMKEALILNSGLALLTFGRARNLREGIRLADEAIKSQRPNEVAREIRRVIA